MTHTHCEGDKLHRHAPSSTSSSRLQAPMIRSDLSLTSDATKPSPSTGNYLTACKASRSTAEPSSSRHEPRRHQSVSRLRRPQIFKKYKPIRVIGQGQSGTVISVEERSSGKPSGNGDTMADVSPRKGRTYACKIIDISRGAVDNGKDNLTSLEDVMNEIEVMQSLRGHSNVQDLVDFDIEDDKAYIVSSLCRGGDLSQALQMRGCLCEEDAKNIMAGIFSGLGHLHSQGVVHRDIKLDNILLVDSKHDMSKLKIIDLGFAEKTATSESTDCEGCYAICGTPMYLAPEIIRPILRKGNLQNHVRLGTQVDLWSCGVVLYMLLSGYPPFQTKGNASIIELLKDIDNVAYDFSDPVWECVSDDAMSMVEGLLEADPAKRLTAEEALRHPWMLNR